jgi:hypothetical protein
MLGHEVFLRLPLPRGLRPRDDPLVRFHSPTGCDPRSPPERLSTPAPPMGLSALQRHQHRESTQSPGLPPPGTFPPRGFSPPRGLPPPGTLRVYFAPQALTGFLPSGVFPPKKPSPPCSVATLPSWRFLPTWLSVANRQKRAPPPHAASVVPGPFSPPGLQSPPGVRTLRRAD